MIVLVATFYSCAYWVYSNGSHSFATRFNKAKNGISCFCLEFGNERSVFGKLM